MTTDNIGIQGFSKFIDSISAARHEAYAVKPAAKVQDASEFDAMKAHILGLYEGVEVQHSFVDENGQVFDCIPVEQQPSLRGGSTPPASPPDAPSAALSGKTLGPALSVEPLRSDRRDRFGRAMACPPGTIPMRRVTLDEMSQKETLRDFFRKAPGGVGRHPRLGPEGIAPNVHKWAHAYQAVDNLGGHSYLNLWAPAVGSQIFSLSQHWYAGGSPVQTVEIGWQVYPGKYQTNYPALFIYWTADGYQTTGCYNLDCSAFVQTNPNWHLGGAVSPISTYGGAQYELALAAYLYAGNWWLYAGGFGSGNAIGYYPASLYGAGPLATHASNVDYGGEVVDVTAWPPMGSGAFASDWWTHAAYQRDIESFPTGGGTQNTSLTGVQDSANCFTIDVGFAAAPWNEYCFFGGPGGTNCT